jgi:hypothetical protein
MSAGERYQLLFLGETHEVLQPWIRIAYVGVLLVVDIIVHITVFSNGALKYHGLNILSVVAELRACSAGSVVDVHPQTKGGANAARFTVGVPHISPIFDINVSLASFVQHWRQHVCCDHHQLFPTTIGNFRAKRLVRVRCAVDSRGRVFCYLRLAMNTSTRRVLFCEQLEICDRHIIQESWISAITSTASSAMLAAFSLRSRELDLPLQAIAR